LSSKSAFRRSVVIASDSEAISSFWGLLRRYASRNDSLHYAQSINRIVVKHCKTKIGREGSCHNSLLSFKRVRIPILFVTLTITLLIFGLGSQSAFSQCAGLCLYEQDTPQTKLPPAGVDAGDREPATIYFEPEGMSGLNRDLLVSGVYGVSNEHKSGVFASDRISVSQGLSDEFALNEMDSTGTVGENTGSRLYAANDAGADSNSQTSKSKHWEFILIPYVWFTGLNADITVNGATADVDASFLDLAKDLDFAFMFHGEAWWKGKFGGFVDTVYSKLSDSGNISLPNLSSVNVGLTSKLFILEFGGLYRAGTWDIGSPYNSFVQKAKPSVTLDFLAGGRYWHLNNELDIHGPLGILPSEIDKSRQWVDFIVGGRMGLNFYKKLTFEVRSDIGGFGLGSSSKIAWNIVSAIGYELPWYRITPLIGYRALYDDFSTESGSNSFESKFWLHGPVLGIAFIF
ncbi:MAG TPA: hypothetical protein VJ327_06950, partial [Patescibacteria group bacterium]|nr:hypothetical protein [Patescibacteria group bacterium]